MGNYFVLINGSEITGPFTFKEASHYKSQFDLQHGNTSREKRELPDWVIELESCVILKIVVDEHGRLIQ